VNVDAIRARKFKVALDGVNGAGSVMTPEFLTDSLGCDLTAISIDPTMPFPREAEPRPETIGELAALVRAKGCDIGFAQDPDGDRLAVVDENGNTLDNDDVLALAVDAALERLPGDVVVNLTTSSVIDDIAAAHGRKVWRTPVGEANVVERIQAIKAAIGGEGTSAGIIFPAVHLCRDSYSGMAMFLDRMASTGMTMSQLTARLPRYHRRIGKVAFAHGMLGTLMQRLEDEFPDARTDRSDGLKLLWDSSWIHVRASNTEPILRFSAEAKTEEAVETLYRNVEAKLR
jgi:phosphomannomutase